MSYIAPDMDDLLRKAGDNYSLKQGANRWEEIASKLESNSKPVKKQAKRSYKKYLAVMLLMLSFLFLVDFFSRNEGNKNIVQQSGKSEQTKNTDNEVSVAKQKGSDHELPIGQLNTSDDNNNLNLTQEVRRQLDLNETSGPTRIRNDNDQNEITAFDTPYSIGDRPEIEASIKNERTFETIDLSYGPALNIQIKNRTAVQLLPFNSKKKKANKNIDDGFYYGLMAGSGFTNIKGQQTTKAGFEYGILTGYSFSDKISVETGLLLSKKYYQTSGEYFSMKTISSSMPTDMKIMDVKSSTDFLQVPIHVRYDLKNRNDHRFFASAGISSYILFKESNSYHTMHNGTEAMMYSTYKNSHNYIAGSFDISIGYEKDIGTKTGLRIEPYLQLPLSGTGVGELQLKTAGIRIALTRSSN